MAKSVCQRVKHLQSDFNEAIKATNIWDTNEAQEVSFSLCEDKRGRISAQSGCIGDKCSVSILKCPKGMAPVGTFHTHPYDDDKLFYTTFSCHDIRDATKMAWEEMSCIGYDRVDGPNPYQVKCIDLSNLTPKEKSLLRWECDDETEKKRIATEKYLKKQGRLCKMNV